MDINQFLLSLLDRVSKLHFVKKVDITTEAFILKGRLILEKNRFVQIYFNELTKTTSFALIHNDRRVWGIDFDNMRGWHLHPLENHETHYSIANQTIKSIIHSLEEIWPLLE
ncbi:MAG: hypothetical protein ACUZ8H_06080 [Candidatus Anammoxibacter sp.]